MPAGRPTQYKSEYEHLAEVASRLGATDADLADLFGVSETTINNWKLKHPQFVESLKGGKDYANNQVKQALFKRAIGCSVQDSDIKVIDGQIVVTPVEKNFPPDTAACMAWLHNRDPENWRPRKAVEEDGGSDDRLVDALTKLADRLPS